MKTAVLSNFDGDEFSYQYLNWNELSIITNELHEKLEYYCNTNASIKVHVRHEYHAGWLDGWDSRATGAAARDPVHRGSRRRTERQVQKVTQRVMNRLASPVTARAFTSTKMVASAGIATRCSILQRSTSFLRICNNRYALPSTVSCFFGIAKSSADPAISKIWPSKLLLDVVRMSGGWRVAESIRSDPRTSISYEEFLQLCERNGVKAAEAPKLLDSLVSSSCVIRLQSSSDTILLNPGHNLREVARRLDLPYRSMEDDRLDALRATLDDRLQSLRPMQSQYDHTVSVARGQSHRRIGAMVLYLGLQNSFFFWMTFYVWSWDIMEPITYFWSQSLMLLMFGYFIKTNGEWGFQRVRDKMVDRRIKRLMQKVNFNETAFKQQHEQVVELRSRIADIERTL